MFNSNGLLRSHDGWEIALLRIHYSEERHLAPCSIRYAERTDFMNRLNGRAWHFEGPGVLLVTSSEQASKPTQESGWP